MSCPFFKQPTNPYSFTTVVLLVINLIYTDLSNIANPKRFKKLKIRKKEEKNKKKKKYNWFRSYGTVQFLVANGQILFSLKRF